MGLARRHVSNGVLSAVRAMSSPRRCYALDFVPAKPEAIGPVCYPTYKQGENRPHGAAWGACRLGVGRRWVPIVARGLRCWCLLADLTAAATDPLLFGLTRDQKPTAVWCCWKE